MRGIKQSVVAAAAVLATTAAAAPAANASFGTSVAGAPATQQASAHDNLHVVANFTGNESVKTFVVDLPAGELGDPNAVQKCTLAQANAKQCPETSRVGDVVAHAKADTRSLLGVMNAEAPGGVYVMETRGDEPARLFTRLTPSLAGVGIGDPIIAEIPITLRSPGDYGLRNTVADLPETASIPLLGLLGGDTTPSIQMTGMDMTFMGTPPNSPRGSFMTNPSTCRNDHRIKVWAISRSGTEAAGASPAFSTTGCGSVPMTPALEASPAEQPANAPTELTANVTMPYGQPGLGQSHVSKATVVMPEGTALSAGVGSRGLEDCTDAQFGIDRTEVNCPALSQIGTVSFVSPLVGELQGKVFLGRETPDAKLRLMAYAKKGQALVKLIGKTMPDPATGQLTAVFDDLPQQPFKSFKLTFRGGDNAVLKAPPTCGTHKMMASFEGFSGARADAAATFTVSGCPAKKFSPTMTTTVDPAQAGADVAFSTVIAREDDDELIDGVRVSLPSGLLARLASVPMCSVDDARAGNCSADSRVGTVTAAAGTGPAPAVLQGPVYLTHGFDGGIAGLAIEVPAKVGPVDLGKVVVMGSMKTRSDVGVDMTIASMPRIQGGVPLFMKRMALDLNKPGFMFNSSSCDEKVISGTITSQSGMTADVSSPYQATGCDQLKFNPAMVARVSGNVASPAFATIVASAPGDATMKSASLILPKGVGANLPALAKACPEETYRQGGCPATAKIGKAKAESPLIPLPLEGDVTLVKIPGQAMPSLAMDLQGLININLQVKNAAIGSRIQSTIIDIPDTPLSRFTLALAGNGLLRSSRAELCSAKQIVDGTFTSHAGHTKKAAVPADVSAICGTTAKGTLTARGWLKKTGKGKMPTLRVRVSGKGAKLKSIRVSIPRNKLRVVRSKLKGRARGVIGGKFTSKNLTPRTSSSKTRAFVTIRATGTRAKKGTSAIELRISRGALRRAGVKTGQRITLGVKATDVSGKSRNLKVRVRAGK